MNSAPLFTETPSGVRGWLLFLCAILTVVFPITCVLPTVTALQSGHNPLGLTYTLCDLALGVFSFIAGLRLWRIRPNAVAFTKLFLLLRAAFAIAVYVRVLVGTGAALDPNSAESMVSILASPLLFTVLWYSYLTKSRRVHATYPTDYSVATGKL
jgi:hypothetical protein